MTRPVGSPSMGIEILFLILAIAVVAFGIGVVVVSRRNSAVTQAPPPRPARPTTPPPEIEPEVGGKRRGRDEDLGETVSGRSLRPGSTMRSCAPCLSADMKNCPLADMKVPIRGQ